MSMDLPHFPWLEYAALSMQHPYAGLLAYEEKKRADPPPIPLPLVEAHARLLKPLLTDKAFWEERGVQPSELALFEPRPVHPFSVWYYPRTAASLYAWMDLARPSRLSLTLISSILGVSWLISREHPDLGMLTALLGTATGGILAEQAKRTHPRKLEQIVQGPLLQVEGHVWREAYTTLYKILQQGGVV